MDGADLPGECLCGSIDFERVVVHRRPAGPITTDFVHCLGCHAMYFVPLPPVVVSPRQGGSKGSGAIGGPDGGRSCQAPTADAHDALMRDVRDAAKDYVKPGRSTPPRGRR